MSMPDSKALLNQTPMKQPDAEAESVPPVESGSESPEAKVEGGEEEEQEEGECGFCLFMKGGRCREAFIDWEKCVEEADKNKEDLVNKCAQVTTVLKQCMEAHSDYYEPILRAEKAAKQQAIAELEKEKETQSEHNASKDGASSNEK